MKWKPGFKTLLNLPKNSTVLTVFGDTILIDKLIRITSSTTAGITHSQPNAPIAKAGTTISNNGTIKRIIEK